MRSKSFIIASVLLLVTAAGLYAFQSQPTMSITTATPSTVYVKSTTTVTISANSTDSRVITTGVNLVQVNPITGAQTVEGTLASKGNGVFSITIQPNTSAPQLFSYEVSAAFRGLLKRSISPPITVAVAPIGVVLPPDPGPAGMATLAGIDTTGTGVRDDIARWIAVSQPTSARVRAALTQGALAIEQVLLKSNSQTQAIAAITAEDNAQECLAGIMGSIKPAGTLMRMLEAIALNTPTRTNAYLSANSLNSGTAFAIPSPTERLSLCTFNANALPN